MLNIHRFKLDIEKSKTKQHILHKFLLKQPEFRAKQNDIISEKHALAHAKLNRAKLLHHVVRAYRFGSKECHRKIYHFLCVSNI